MTNGTRSEEQTLTGAKQIRGKARETKGRVELPSLHTGGENVKNEARAFTSDGRAPSESAVRAYDPPVEPAGFAERQARTAARAYELWQLRGCPAGSDQEDWFAAEREIAAREAEDVA